MPLLLFMAGVAITAFGVMVIVPVTPNGSDRGNYAFTVTTNAVADGVSVRIDIQTKQRSASTRVSAGLYLKQGRGGNAAYDDKQPNGQPMPPVTLAQRGREWEADFMASNELLQNTNLYFNFVVEPNVIGVSGQRTLMPGGWIYELNLREFLRP